MSASPETPRVTPVCLLILDGFGMREPAPDNAVALAHKPNWDQLWRECPHTVIDASEKHVGLPSGQMGNSEVGHLNIGAGRVVYQDYTRIDHAIETGEFFSNPVLVDAVTTAKTKGGAVHVMGLLSPGGVHSHEDQLAAMVKLSADAGVKATYIHAFLDGRDTPPKSAAASIAKMEDVCRTHPGARIATLCGRYFAMDRDKRWDRVEAAYRAIVDGQAEYRSAAAEAGLAAAYERGETDEFVKATVIAANEQQVVKVADGDVLVFMNFRADRARQITTAFTSPDFAGFQRPRWPQLARFVCLTGYGDDYAHLPTAFPPQGISNSFGEYLSRLGLKQLRIAETEKYAHVTFFFSGGVEEPYAGEDRILVPSPKVATYDLKPEMSAPEVTDQLVAAIRSGKYDAIICNYANGDMVGHTGNLDAAIKAVEALDTSIGRVVQAMRESGGEVLITADHGNAEMMFDPESGQAHTAHTLNLVPFVYVGRPAKLAPGGALQDVAPTLLRMLGLPQPDEMTGKPLVEFVA